MAIFYFNVEIVSKGKKRKRGKGKKRSKSITATSVYNSGEKLRDNCIDKTYYSYRKDVLFKEILLPPGTPRKFFYRQTLLNELIISEKRKDAQLARNIKIALPNELSLNEHIALVKELVIENFIKFGLCADIAIHAGRLDKNRKPISIAAVHERKDNPHAHIIIPFRPVDENGFCRTKTQTRYMNSKIYLKKWRAEWARLINREYERRGLDIIVSEKSLADQGIDREPTKHLGPEIMALENLGFQTKRGDEHRRIIRRNREREKNHEMERQKSLERNHTLERFR
jgi:ATP-dependent exoDNAse (exonuclease V) alpha subunit